MNGLTGAIPPELGNLASLKLLYLYSNELMGELPSSLTALTALNHFRFQDNAGLCAPADDAFQGWLREVGQVSGDTCAA